MPRDPVTQPPDSGARPDHEAMTTALWGFHWTGDSAQMGPRLVVELNRMGWHLVKAEPLRDRSPVDEPRPARYMVGNHGVANGGNEPDEPRLDVLDVELWAAVLWMFDTMPESIGEGNALTHWNDSVFPVRAEVKEMYRYRASILVGEVNAAASLTSGAADPEPPHFHGAFDKDGCTDDHEVGEQEASDQ